MLRTNNATPVTTQNAKMRVNFEMTPISGIRNENKDGKDYLVAPVVMMVVGVHNAIYYSDKELGKFPKAWNGQPVVIRHPEEGGQHVSANASPDMMEIQVGRLFNTTYEDGKLKSELWLDSEKMNKFGANILQMWKEGKMIDVSIGAFEEDLITQGVWNNENYVAVATNIRPDHLALLPDQEGSCSLKDGAGAPRVNVKQKIKNCVNALLDACGVDKTEPKPKEEPTAPAPNNQSLNNPQNHENQNGGKVMNEKVEALIANQATKFGEDDRKWLEGLTEDQLDKMIPAEVKADPAPKANVATPAPQADPAPKADPKDESKLDTILSALGKLPETINDAIDAKLTANAKQPVIDRLVKNDKCPFSEETLKAMNAKELASVQKQYNPMAGVDFSALAAGDVTVNVNESAGAPPMEKVFTAPVAE